MRFSVFLFAILVLGSITLGNTVFAEEETAEIRSDLTEKQEQPEVQSVSIVATSFPTLMQSRPAIGFLKITNPLDTDITLYDVEAPAVSDRVEIHTHESEDGVMRMLKLDELKIPAQSTLNFQGTKLHLMLMDMKRELKVGDSYPLTLKLKKEEGSLIPIEVEVKVIER